MAQAFAGDGVLMARPTPPQILPLTRFPQEAYTLVDCSLMEPPNVGGEILSDKATPLHIFFLKSSQEVYIAVPSEKPTILWSAGENQLKAKPKLKPILSSTSTLADAIPVESQLPNTCSVGETTHLDQVKVLHLLDSSPISPPDINTAVRYV